jgi:hypothetical protein
MVAVRFSGVAPFSSVGDEEMGGEMGGAEI